MRRRPVPWPAPGAEQALAGQSLHAQAIASAARGGVAEAEPLEQNAYKVPLVVGLVEEQLESLRQA